MSLHVQTKALDVFQRRVRPRKDTSDDEVPYDGDSTSPGAESIGAIKESDPDDLEIDQDMEIGSVSFGALAKAQSSIRIRMNSSSAERQEVPHWQAQKTRHNQDSRDHIGEELPRKERKEAFGRSSKHAPTELSSKKAVSRRREAVMVPKRESRDPRFDPLTGPLDEGKTKKNYAFLESYREIEMKSIRDEIRRAKDDAVKETLKKELSSMESKKKAQETKDKQQDILNAHRKKEKELIKQGKKPFYLKKAEQKKLALVERYSKLKGKQLSRIIERKRKKKASKERKNMPSLRREVKS
ncbi:MAG: rRNA biogenesis protein rrp36 [Trichoglossum hirsutum]|nr:MAG: rRNA biogenesis protein rrp36 [Trichoglossum hirsutum]